MRWLRRLAYFVFFMLWLGVMLFPCMAFTLAMQQQIQIGSSEGSHLRVFLLQEEDTEGVGIEWERPYLRAQATCHITTVAYMLWAGEGENAVYCQCQDPQTGTFSPAPAQSCGVR